MALVAPAAAAASAYCGSPPDPASLWSRWNLDPLLLIALAAVVLGYGLLARGDASGRGVGAPWRRACFLAGWLVGSAALISPLCPLSVSLFSARVGQHMILEMIAAPLIALGWPGHFLAARRVAAELGQTARPPAHGAWPRRRPSRSPSGSGTPRSPTP